MGRPFIFDDENQNSTGISTSIQSASRNKAVRQVARQLNTNNVLLTISNDELRDELQARENLQQGAETQNVLMQSRQEQQQEIQGSNNNVIHDFATIPLSPALTRAFRTSESRMQKRLETQQYNVGGDRQGIDSIGQLQCRIPIIIPQITPQHNQDRNLSTSLIGAERSPFIVGGI
eukprot:TRINITY_DN5040_c0_g4_i2.p5 TRINITY_DN5040_c0_g4~~TRINITY_DN5040_c0_g4_i2.p5  ORF type:complete len:176 (-),score=14.58 TRINITY_DN5040_c0_g4_i2:2687-3214(-)